MPLGDEPVVQQGRGYALSAFRKRAVLVGARAAAAAAAAAAVVPGAGAGAGAGAAGAGAGAGAGAAKSDAEWLRGERHVFEPADIQALRLKTPVFWNRRRQCSGVRRAAESRPRTSRRRSW